jgi:hypothetical protein
MLVVRADQKAYAGGFLAGLLFFVYPFSNLSLPVCEIPITTIGARSLTNHETPWQNNKILHRCDKQRQYRSGDHKR